MKKNQIILILVSIFVLGGIIGFTLLQKQKTPNIQETNLEANPEVLPEKAEEVFFLSGMVLDINTQDNFLIIKPEGKETEIKVLVDNNTKLSKFSYSLDPKDNPEEGVYIPIETEIKISDFETGDRVFIKAKTNIAEKTEFGNIVEYIQIYP